jgi:hypothetical protein
LLHALGAQAMNAAPALRPAATRHAPAPSREPLLEEGFEVASFDVSPWKEGAPVARVERGSRELRSDATTAPVAPADRNRLDDLHAPRIVDAQAAPHHEDALPPTLRAEVDDDTASARPPMRTAPTLQPRQRAFPIAAPRLPSSRDPSAGITTPQQPDVHIHIGRIEVIAPAPAAPPKRDRPAPAHKSVSLEDYLRKGAKPT